MCKSAAEGGQRCASHTGKTLKTAIARYKASPSDDTYMAVQAARAEFASTPTGAATLMKQMDGLSAESADGWAIRQALKRGALIRERNAELAAATVDLGQANRRLHLAGEPGTPPAILERLYLDKMAHVSNRALRNPAATPRMLDHAMHSEDPFARLAVAEHPNAGMRLATLRRDPSTTVRAAVAANPATERNVLAVMWQEETDRDIRSILAQRLDLHVIRAA